MQRIYNIRNQPIASQGELIGAVNEEGDPDAVVVCAAGSLPAEKLMPVFEREDGLKGRLSIQTHPANYRNDPVDPAIVAELYDRVPDFQRAYDEDGMCVEEFDQYGATVRTLRGFITSYHELIQVIREEFMLPNPDL